MKIGLLVGSYFLGLTAEKSNESVNVAKNMAAAVKKGVNKAAAKVAAATEPVEDTGSND